MNTQRRDDIEKELRDITIALTASENWSPSWIKKGVYFKKLVMLEAEMERATRDYLRSLSHRIGHYVDWGKYHVDLQTLSGSDVTTLEAYDVSVLFDDTQFANDEQTQIEQFISEIYINGAAIGWLYEQAKKDGMPMTGPVTVESPLYKTIQESVDPHIQQLAQYLDETTTKEVVRSIQESIALGESHDLAVQRLMSVINSSVRAEMIAQTEMVRAWSIGVNKFGIDNGAKSKTWAALPGADEGSVETPCLDNDGTTVDIDQDFVSGDEYPPAHPRCRCDVSNNYETAAELA